MKDVKQAYDLWAGKYDSDINKTRDLEGIALKDAVGKVEFDNCLEIGCGTGKNTFLLASLAKKVKAVDFSVQMLEKAKSKINLKNVTFIQADINQDWRFIQYDKFDLVTFSLVLEHIEDLVKIFKKLKEVVSIDGYVYIGELHPYKQYNGSKARFDTGNGIQTVPCFNHNLSDFILAAKVNGFQIIDLEEYFDNNDKSFIPRILSMLFKKL